MDDMVRQAWLPIFAKHDTGGHPPPSADDFMDKHSDYIFYHAQNLPNIELSDVCDRVRQLDKNGSGGLDGWRAELKALPEVFYDR